MIIKNTTTLLLSVYYLIRGTASKKQMEANLKYTQRAIVFGNLTTATLDHLDGLAIKPCKLCIVYFMLPSLTGCSTVSLISRA